MNDNNRGGFRVQNKVVTNFCKIDTIYITIIALIFVATIMIIVVVIIIIVNVASGDWSMTIWLLLILSWTLFLLSFTLIIIIINIIIILCFTLVLGMDTPQNRSPTDSNDTSTVSCALQIDEGKVTKELILDPSYSSDII